MADLKKDFDLEWFKKLKVGDDVVIDLSSMWNKDDYKLCKVEKITPTGRVKLNDGSQYQPDGKKIGESYCYPLMQVTQEILDAVERRRLMYQLKFDKFEGLLSIERLKILLEWQDELLKK
jgi:hypothetical protein